MIVSYFASRGRVRGPPVLGGILSDCFYFPEKQIILQLRQTIFRDEYLVTTDTAELEMAKFLYEKDTVSPVRRGGARYFGFGTFSYDKRVLAEIAYKTGDQFWIKMVIDDLVDSITDELHRLHASDRPTRR